MAPSVQVDVGKSTWKEGSAMTTSANWNIWKLALTNSQETSFFRVQAKINILKAQAWMPIFKLETKFVTSQLLAMTLLRAIVVYFQSGDLNNGNIWIADF